MNISVLSTTLTKHLSTSLFSSFFCMLLFTSCKKESDQSPVPDPVVADSTSISSLIVSCKSSDASATGFATIDIQQFFLAKKLVSTTVKGKIFSVKTVNEADFKAVIDKIILDLQVPESYFKNYDSFLSIVEERFKAKTGYQKAYDINQVQLEQLFNKQGVALAFQENSLKGAFLKNIFFASAGMGTLRLAPLAETFTLSRFLGLMAVGTRISGLVTGYYSIRNFFGTGANRSTTLTRDDQVVFESFINSISGPGYSYSYPLPPSPTPVFDAPVWYWHQYTLDNTGAFVSVIPPDASTTTWSTAQDRYQAIRLKSQQVAGVTVTENSYFSGGPGVMLTDTETAYILYSANFTQRFKDQTITLWYALDDRKHEAYQIALFPTGNLNILKFINASVVNGNYFGDPAWSVGWSK